MSNSHSQASQDGAGLLDCLVVAQVPILLVDTVIYELLGFTRTFVFCHLAFAVILKITHAVCRLGASVADVDAPLRSHW